jgi:hypothetical protein
MLKPREQAKLGNGIGRSYDKAQASYSRWEDAKEIRGLKVDVWELSNLVRLLAAFVPRPVSGMVEEKAAIEFETQLHAVLQKHGIER